MTGLKLNYKRTVLVGFAFFLIMAFWTAYDAIIPLILTNHYGLPQVISGVVMSADNILAVFLLPIFGAVSDKVMTRLGKRTPFILIGTVAAVISFVALMLIDAMQINALAQTNIPATYSGVMAELNEATKALNAAYDSGSQALINAAQANVDMLEDVIEALREQTLDITISNLWPLIGFIGLLLVVLIAMSIFRSPAVALMPDITVKPLRSKGNAIINLMGTAGAVIVLALGMVFGTDSNHHMKYIGYILAVSGVMIAALVVFFLTVKENKWADDMRAETEKYKIDETSYEERMSGKRKLSSAEKKSLILILSSVALWYIGYNSITSKFSVYSTTVLRFDFNLTLIIAQIAAIVAYIPVGMLASKIGRKKSILAGIVLLTSAFLIGNFVSSTTPEPVLIPIFIVAGLGWATINVNSFPMAVEIAKGGEIGKYTGYYYTASMAAQIVAPILSGALYDLFDIITDGNGMRVVFFAFGTLFVAASFVTMLFVKHGDIKVTKDMETIEDFG